MKTIKIPVVHLVRLSQSRRFFCGKLLINLPRKQWWWDLDSPSPRGLTLDQLLVCSECRRVKNENDKNHLRAS